MKKRTFLFFAVYVLLLMLFCAGSSPFVDYMSVDSHVFFGIGRGMAHGKTAYLELFDHKGWYIFFFNFLGALISSSGTIGLLIIESCFFLANAVICYFVARLFLKRECECIFFSVSMLLAMLNVFTFSGGNITESYALTFQLLSIYLVLRYDRLGKVAHPPVYMLIHGICVGIVFNLRANMIMMWGAIALVIIIRLLTSGEAKNAFANILAGVLGVLIGMLPPLVYGICTDSLPEMLRQTILFNLAYSEGSGFLKNAIRAFCSVGGLLSLVLGVISVIAILRSQEQKYMKLLYIMAWVLSAVSVSMSGRSYGHYFEYMIPLCIPAAVWFVKQLRLARWMKAKTVWAGTVCAIFVLTICANACTPIHLFMDTSRKRYIETANEIARMYKKEYPEGGTVLATTNNAIYYNKMDVIPSVKHFYTPSISYEQYPDGIDEQIESVLCLENDVIVAVYRDWEKRFIFDDGLRNEEILACLNQNYRLLYEKAGTQVWRRI